MISKINVCVADKYYYMAKGEIDFATRRQISFSHIHGYISSTFQEVHQNIVLLCAVYVTVKSKTETQHWWPVYI